MTCSSSAERASQRIRCRHRSHSWIGCRGAPSANCFAMSSLRSLYPMPQRPGANDHRQSDDVGEQERLKHTTMWNIWRSR